MPVNSLNEVSCGGSSTGNVGLATCGYKLLRQIGVIALPASLVIPSSALVSSATFAAWFKTVEQASLRANRGFIIGRFKSIASNGQDVQFFTYEDGSRIPVRDAVRAIRAEVDSDFTYFRQLMAIDLTSYKVLEIWETVGREVLIVGTTVTDPTTAITSFAGVNKSLFYAEPPAPPANNEPERYYLQLEDQDIRDITLNRAVFKVSNTFFGDMQVFAIKDIILENRTPSGSAAGVFVLRPTLVGGKSLSGPDMVPALASSTYIFARNSATLASITLTTVGVDATDTDNISVLADTTDTDYISLGAGGFVEFYTAATSVLNPAIGPYEGKPIQLPRV